MSDVFISHSSKDAEIANSVCKYLEDRGLSCWMAPRNIVPGADWAASINTAITTSKVFLVIYSKNSAASTQVPREIGLAGSRENVYTIPYKIDNTPLKGSFEYYLTGAHWVNANYEKKDYKLEELLTVITAVTGKNIQNITNNTYIDNLHIHSGEGASQDITEQINAAKKAVEELNSPVKAKPPELPDYPGSSEPAKDKKPNKKKLGIIIAAAAAVLLTAGIIAAVFIASDSGKSSSSSSSSKSSSKKTTTATKQTETEEATEEAADPFELFDEDDMCSYSALIGASRTDIIDYFGDDYNTKKNENSAGFDSLQDSTKYYINYENYKFTFLDGSPKGLLSFDFNSEGKVIDVCFVIANYDNYEHIKSLEDFESKSYQIYRILEGRYGTTISETPSYNDNYGNILVNGATDVIKEAGYSDKRIYMLITYDKTGERTYKNTVFNDDFLAMVAFIDPDYIS